MIELPGVTLCAVDTRTPGLALQALQRSRQGVRYARTLLLTDAPGAAGLTWPAGVDQGCIEPITSSSDYSHFMLMRLLDWVETPHVLVVQWDGFVVSPGCWEDGFLDADYLGAPWGDAPQGHVVGNGGFSLRSRRLLLALRDPAVAARLHHPEDTCIGQTLRTWLERQHGIVFGNLAQAQRFAYENEPPAGGTFGFHGMMNLPRALGMAAFAELIDRLPPALVSGRDGFKTARALLRQGSGDLALRLLDRRAEAGALDARSRLLRWQCLLRGKPGSPPTAAE
jgi:hypothetical protein